MAARVAQRPRGKSRWAGASAADVLKEFAGGLAAIGLILIPIIFAILCDRMIPPTG